MAARAHSLAKFRTGVAGHRKTGEKILSSDTDPRIVAPLPLPRWRAARLCSARGKGTLCQV